MPYSAIRSLSCWRSVSLSLSTDNDEVNRPDLWMDEMSIPIIREKEKRAHAIKRASEREKTLTICPSTLYLKRQVFQEYFSSIHLTWIDSFSSFWFPASIMLISSRAVIDARTLTHTHTLVKVVLFDGKKRPDIQWANDCVINHSSNVQSFFHQ